MSDEKAIRLDFGASLAVPAGETTYSLADLSEEHITALANGYVPRVVKAMAMSCLNFADEDERRASRPVPKARRKSA